MKAMVQIHTIKNTGSQCFGFSSKNILRNIYIYMILTHTLKDKQQYRKEIEQLFIGIVEECPTIKKLKGVLQFGPH